MKTCFHYWIMWMTCANLSKTLAHDCLITDLSIPRRNFIICSANSQFYHIYAYWQTRTMQMWCICERKVDKELGCAVQNEVLDFEP